jgi:hypothetical protein
MDIPILAANTKVAGIGGTKYQKRTRKLDFNSKLDKI